MAPFTEVQIPFAVPGVDKPCFTYCKIFGDLKTTQKRPLIVVHGGPGWSHDYLLSIADLADDGTVVIFYDQFGGGRSSHLPEKNGDTRFWVEELFLTEFDNDVRHLGIQDNYNVLGQSWGGMLMGRWASRQPKGLHRLVIANSPASVELWVEAANYLLAQLPQDVQVCTSQSPSHGVRLTRIRTGYTEEARRCGHEGLPGVQGRKAGLLRAPCVPHKADA